MGKSQEVNNFRLQHPTEMNKIQDDIRGLAARAANREAKRQRTKKAKLHQDEQFQLPMAEEKEIVRSGISGDVCREVVHRMLAYNKEHPKARKTFEDCLAEYQSEQDKQEEN